MEVARMQSGKRVNPDYIRATGWSPLLPPWEKVPEGRMRDLTTLTGTPAAPALSQRERA